MRHPKLELTAEGSTDWFVLPNRNPFTVSLELVAENGATAHVEYRIAEEEEAEANDGEGVYVHADLTGITNARAVGTMISPVGAIRLTQEGAGNSRLHILQAGA